MVNQVCGPRSTLGLKADLACRGLLVFHHFFSSSLRWFFERAGIGHSTPYGKSQIGLHRQRWIANPQSGLRVEGKDRRSPRWIVPHHRLCPTGHGSLQLVPNLIARRPEELILDGGLIWVKKSQGSNRTRRPWADDPYYWIISPRLKDEGATGSVLDRVCMLAGTREIWRERSGL